jgi:hypothetical protein
MRPATTVLLLATLALTGCSGTARGTGADGGATPDFGTSPGDPVPDTGSGAGTASPTAAAPSEYDTLFTTPASASVTGNSLDGVWAGSMSNTNDDVRLVFTPTTITIAVRCNSGHSVGTITTIGMTVSAVTSRSSIRTLESKSTGGPGCRILVHPQSFSRISTGSGGSPNFNLSDTSLDFGPYSLFSGDGTSSRPWPTFSKMSDDT